MATESRRILLVDDCVEDCEYTERLLRKAKNRRWQFTEAMDGARGLALASSAGPFDCILVDYNLPDMDGMEFLELLRGRNGGLESATVMLTGTGDESVAVRAMKQGANDYISKDKLQGEQLFRVVENAIFHFQADLAQRKIRQALVESEERFRELADAMPQIVWTADPDGRPDYLNRRWFESIGPVAMQAGDEGWAGIVHPQDLQANRDGWNAAVRSGTTFEIQSRLRNWKTGLYSWHLLRALAQRNSQGAIVKWVCTATDVDEKEKKSEELERRVEERTAQLRQSLAESTTLLQEVHHRVKNNLQLVCSLLSMQIDYPKADGVTGPMDDALSRVQAMSLIHEQIYRSETLSDLDFGYYIGDLTRSLFNAYCTDLSRIKLDLKVEPVRLTVDEAIPCGLILNELVSNSLKHAFAGGREGILRISLRSIADGYLELVVADNGIGMSASVRFEDRRSLGLQVVRTLVGQIRGTLQVSEGAGTTFTLTWQPHEAAATVADLAMARAASD